MKNLNHIASCLAELGHEVRLRIFRHLMRQAHTRVCVGDLQAELNIPSSTLSHHIGRLLAVGLITQEREGRTLYCKAQLAQLQQVMSFLTEECCQGEVDCNLEAQLEPINCKETPKTSCC